MVMQDFLKLINGTFEEKTAIIYKNTEKQLLNLLYPNRLNTENSENIYIIPDSLEYIVTDVSLLRLGRLGSEGFTSESINGSSVHYSMPKEDFDAYKKEINSFVNLNSDTGTNGSVLFI